MFGHGIRHVAAGPGGEWLALLRRLQGQQFGHLRLTVNNRCCPDRKPSNPARDPTPMPPGALAGTFSQSMQEFAHIPRIAL